MSGRHASPGHRGHVTHLDDENRPPPATHHCRVASFPRPFIIRIDSFKGGPICGAHRELRKSPCDGKAPAQVKPLSANSTMVLQTWQSAPPAGRSTDRFLQVHDQLVRHGAQCRSLIKFCDSRRPSPEDPVPVAVSESSKTSNNWCHSAITFADNLTDPQNRSQRSRRD